MKFFFPMLIFLGAMTLSGCITSPVVAVNITNQCHSPVRNVEVVFPGGSYGVAAIAPGKTFRNRIKIFYRGALQVHYDDVSGKSQTIIGPRIDKKDHGRIEISIDEHSALSSALQPD